MLIKTFCAEVMGLEATTITIEVSLTRGVMFHLSGLADTAVKESYDRIRAAIQNVGFKLSPADMTINLSPADIRKEGSGYDLSLAIGILAAHGKVSDSMLHDYMLIGELGLDGQLKPVSGVLSVAIRAKKENFKGLIVPQENAREAAVVDGLDIYGINSLADVIGFFNGCETFEPTVVDTKKEFYTQQYTSDLDFADVKGQESVKRALEVAAAGGHNAILIGPSLITQRPFRSPHHTVSQVAMTGGGNRALPGEVSMAHNGVLFLDELPEFNKSTLEVLRQPLEDRHITISRARYTVDYPCSFMFVASMNPCPCGYYGDPTHHCVCTPGQIQRYMNKISGPLMDRIDIHCEVTVVPFKQLAQMQAGEPSSVIRERVIKARQIQEERFKDFKGIHCNAQMTERMIHQFAEPGATSLDMLRMAMERLSLSARAYSRILKVARTIADLEGSEKVQSHHIAEAIGYRSLDRGDWAERGG